jgi:CRISPR-associated protein Cmr6
MEYRAQAKGRGHRQYINNDDHPPGWRSPIQVWIDEWTKNVDHKLPFAIKDLHTFNVSIDWRLISNSGVDEGFIRPVIGAGGWPMIPGSSIKGLFRRSCPREKLVHWCGSGSDSSEEDLKPGILRFHGAWPANFDWSVGLLDVVHPQQKWQVEGVSNRDKPGANAVVSLFKPRLTIGLSSSDPNLSTLDWAEIKDTLHTALERGIGGRTCAGYGSSGRQRADVVFECALEGQGPASTLLDATPEFRPTMFRAAIRGMALRLFGGICDEFTAQNVVGQLFGSLGNGGQQAVGLLSTTYTDDRSEPQMASFDRGMWKQPNFATKGRLQWRKIRPYGKGESEQLLKDLLAALHGLTMTLGGFGKGWRRPDHRLFYATYNQQNRPKPLIGCHWQWREVDKLLDWIHVQSADELTYLLRYSRKLAEEWLMATTSTKPGGFASWREVIHPDKMKIWVRTAKNADDAKAIHWFHGDLKGTVLAGKMGKVGRIWNRLLPLHKGEGSSSGGSFKNQPNRMERPVNPLERGPAIARHDGTRKAAVPRPGNAWITVHSGQFLESLVLFEERHKSPDFIVRMNKGQGIEAGFQSINFS